MGRNVTWILVFILGPILLLLLAAVFWLPRQRKRRTGGKPPRSLHALTLLLSAAMLISWGVSMAALTIVTAEELYQRFYRRAEDFADWFSQYGHFSEYYDQELGYEWRLGRQYDRPDELEHEIYSAMHGIYTPSSDFALFNQSRQDWRFSLLAEERIPLETAVLFMDGEGNLLYGGRDILFFSAKVVENGRLRTDLHYAWVDLSQTPGEEDPYARLRDIFRRNGSLQQAVRSLRIVGTMEGTELRPVAMDIQLYPTAGEEPEWEKLFGEVQPEMEESLVTVHAEKPEMIVPPREPVTVRMNGEDVRYDSLSELLLDRGYYGGNNTLRSGLYVRTLEYWDRRDPTERKLDMIMLTAVRFYPLKSAISVLSGVYLGTGLLAALLFLLLRSLMKKRLFAPITDVADGMAGDWYNLYTPESAPPMWAEAEKLLEQYRQEQDRRRYDKNEIARLQKALDYAREAEQARRQLTSNLAHELKTPLAVVHSYAEGLLSHIAEEKREQYLDTILSETERMDGLVMEMLDLSRLEAGKVRLSRDEFDLRALAESVLKKLRPLAEERGLEAVLTPGEPCPVTADESRIAQVLENLLSNALRYAPAGTWVKARVGIDRGKACFRVENPVEKPFTVEELSKIWEPFYRRDKARSGKGTGLGLSIAKNIVELHGGKCQVWNTASGVEFSVELPL